MLVPVLALNQSGFLTDNLPYECKDFLLFNHVVPHLLDISGRWWFIETAGAVSSCCLDCIRIVWGRILDFRCIAFFVLQHKTMQKMQCKIKKNPKKQGYKIKLPGLLRLSSMAGSPYSSWSTFFRTRAKKAANPRTCSKR